MLCQPRASHCPWLVADGEDVSEGCDPNGVIAARSQRHRVLPVIDLARSRRPVAGCEDAPVVPEPDRVQVSGRDGAEVAPSLDGALFSSIDSYGQSCAVRSDSD